MLRRRSVAVLVLCAAVSAQSKQPFTFEDMMALKRISDPVVSPDGRWVLFQAVHVDLEANTRTPHLWIVPLAGGEARPLAPGDRGRFAPDGKRIAFLSPKEGGNQIWLQDFDPVGGTLVGTATRLTSLSTEAGEYLWSPDGKNIVFVSDVYPDCPDDVCNRRRDEALAASKVKARVFTRLMFRHWNRFEDDKRSHLFVVPVDGSAPPRDLTPGDDDAPAYHLGGQGFFALSPDGRELAYTVNKIAFTAISTDNDIYVVPLAGGAPKKISVSPGSDSEPLYSPDGRFLAWRMQEQDGFESDRFQLVVYDRSTGAIRNLTPTFDRWVGDFSWAPDSRRLYFVAEEEGRVPLFSVGLEGGEVKRVLEGSNSAPGFTPDGKTMVFTRQSIQAPNEIFKAPVAGGSAAPLTRLNQSVFDRAFTAPLEPFWFTGAEGARVQGFLVKPPGFDPAKKYPVKFLIHGGPQGMWGDTWTYRWNAQLFAAGGYLVVLINPRGSTGYGQRFINEIRGDWGGRVYEDLMRGLDHVEAAFPFVRKGSACAMGASYGGYMVNWILGHSDRFRCAVSHDGTFNSYSQWGTTEELFFKEWEFLGPPWAPGSVYHVWSPHLFAGRMRTPTLVIHGQLDYRVDVSEGFMLFTTLQRQGVPSKMLYFPDEGHWVLKPQNSRLWYQTVNAWVDSYLKE
jgi:dipeptidyl aminopeptidase/acylaminoacyl peptidase